MLGAVNLKILFAWTKVHTQVVGALPGIIFMYSAAGDTWVRRGTKSDGASRDNYSEMSPGLTRSSPRAPD